VEKKQLRVAKTMRERGGKKKPKVGGGKSTFSGGFITQGGGVAQEKNPSCQGGKKERSN